MENKDNVTQLTEKDVRKLLKTFPWVGIGMSLFMGSLTIRALVTAKIEMGYTSAFNQAYDILREDRPMDYWGLVAMLAVLFTLFAGYSVFRIKRRNKYRSEDGDT